MATISNIARRVHTLENKSPASQNQITHIIRQIVNPDGSYGKQIIIEVPKWPQRSE